MFTRLTLLLAASWILAAQELTVRWDELVAPDWKQALELSHGTCLLPIGILEKHGPHVSVGSDLFHATYISREVAKREYVVVFPEYSYGQIYEAKYGEGTFALPPGLISELLQATLDEIARNGLRRS
jgi:creatinine amidohydrolase